VRNTFSVEGYIFEIRFILIEKQDQPKMDFDHDEDANAPDAGSVSSD
jgi:hypothetical protein